ncbi:MAG: hypothetical protein Q8Q49_06275, partial [bacterium]|nr:hypothetical protein [bacterium]
MVHALYASGFLYHAPTQQILLQQISTDSLWSLIGGTHTSKEPAEKAFQRIAKSVLKLNLALSSIHPVYAYVREDVGRKHSILYAEITNINKAPSKKNGLFTWFSRKQITKLPLDPQTKQDIIVGQRVIDSRIREVLGEH